MQTALIPFCGEFIGVQLQSLCATVAVICSPLSARPTDASPAFSGTKGSANPLTPPSARHSTRQLLPIWFPSARQHLRQFIAKEDLDKVDGYTVEIERDIASEDQTLTAGITLSS